MTLMTDQNGSGSVIAALFAHGGRFTFDDIEPALVAILADDRHPDAEKLRALLARYGYSLRSERTVHVRMGLADAMRAAEERVERMQREGL